MLRAHLKLRLIRLATEFSRILSPHETPAKEPFIALFDVVGVGIPYGSCGERLLRALSECEGDSRRGNQKECRNVQPTERTSACHGYSHPQVSEGERGEAMQKRLKQSQLAHFGNDAMLLCRFLRDATCLYNLLSALRLSR